MRDIMDLLNSQGYKAVLSLPTDANKVLKIIDIPLLIFTILFRIRRSGTLIYFVPSNAKRIYLLHFMQRMLGFKLICFINDIEFMRMERSKEKAKEEINAIAAANIILAPNYNSINILQNEYNITNRYIPIGVWDYLSPTPINNQHNNNKVVFAGNLGKSPFIMQLSLIDFTVVSIVNVFIAFGIFFPSFVFVT